MSAGSPFREDLRNAGRAVRRTYVLLNLTAIFLFCQQSLDSPTIGQIGRHFGLSGAQIDARIGGEAMMYQMIVSSLALLLFGYLSDKLNRKALLLAAGAASVLSYCAAPLARSAGEFIAIRALSGIGIGGAVPVIFSLLGDIFPARSRAAAAGVFMAVVNLGYGNGYVMGSLIGAEASLGWRASFYFQSLALATILVALFLLGRLPRRGEADGGADELSPPRIRISDLKNILSNRTNLIFITSCLISTMPMGYIQRFMIDHLITSQGFAAGTAMAVLLIVLSGSIPGDAAGGIVGDSLRARNRRFPPLVSAAAVFGGGALFCVFYSFPIEKGGSLTALIVPAAVGLIGCFLLEAPVPIQKAIMLNTNVPENRGTISALIQTTAQLGFGLGASVGAIGPQLAGFLAVEHSRLFDFKLAAFFWLPVGLSWLLVARSAPRDEARIERIMARRKAAREAGPHSFLVD